MDSLWMLGEVVDEQFREFVEHEVMNSLEVMGCSGGSGRKCC